ncbi:MAG TPA: hypothetical protein VKU41_09135 [Polyangiaceae bacterium]|nr:hypothetical protein [Polyangiaceae bacterium]
MRAIEAFVVILAACGAGCPPNPAPVPPDATDGSPWSPRPDADLTPCQAACTNLTALGCAVEADCVQVMAHVDGARLVRTATGAPMTCAAVAAASSKAGVMALGVSCP